MPRTSSRPAGFKVTEVGNLSLPDVSATTVYFTDADDEHATADAVGKNLGAPVEPRIPALSGQPPGVIVLVDGLTLKVVSRARLSLCLQLAGHRNVARHHVRACPQPLPSRC